MVAYFNYTLIWGHLKQRYIYTPMVGYLIGPNSWLTQEIRISTSYGPDSDHFKEICIYITSILHRLEPDFGLPQRDTYICPHQLDLPILSLLNQALTAAI